MVIDLGLIAAWMAGFWISRKLYRDSFTPLFVYLSMWFTSLLLLRMRVVNYYDLESRSILLIGGSLVAFVVGCVLAGRPADNREQNETLPGRLRPGALERIIKWLFTLNLIGTAIFAVQMDRAYGIHTYLTDPGVIRADFAEWTRVGPLGLLMMLDYPLLICGWIHYLLTRKWRWFCLIVVLVSAETFLRTDRGTTVIYIITCFSLWIYFNRWHSLNLKMVRRIGTTAILLVGYFLLVGFFYGKLMSNITDRFNVADLSVTSEVGLALVTPYVYATSPILGFQEASADVSSLSWGTHTFFPIARVLYAVDILEDRPEAYNFDFYQVPIPVNTYTHLYTFYQDFGAPGVVLLPLLLGYLETRLYLRMKERPTLFLLGACSAFGALNVFSVFVSTLTSIAFWYYFAILFLVSWLCHLKQPAYKFPTELDAAPGAA